MASCTSDDSVAFDADTKTQLLHHIHSSPNSRRVSLADRRTMIEWLTNRGKRPSNQKEFSRRNYVKRTFIWDEGTQDLWAMGESQGEWRLVVTEESIPDVVETVHIQNRHQGWDTTWKDVRSRYYGILRADLIFFLKRCRVCAQDPRKQPKHARFSPDPSMTTHKSGQAHKYRLSDAEEVTNEGDVQC